MKQTFNYSVTRSKAYQSVTVTSGFEREMGAEEFLNAKERIIKGVEEEAKERLKAILEEMHRETLIKQAKKGE